jgi:uncharacterized protein (TIGR00369 family)
MQSVEALNRLNTGTLPGLFGIHVLNVDTRSLTAEMIIKPEFLSPNGYLHAGTVISLADTTCGYATIANLPEGAQNFTTIELKANFLGTAKEGVLTCRANMLHGGKMTQVWDAQVLSDDKPIALFRCTQMILYPRG